MLTRWRREVPGVSPPNTESGASEVISFRLAFDFDFDFGFGLITVAAGDSIMTNSWGIGFIEVTIH
jgi:hypothetical protein